MNKTKLKKGLMKKVEVDPKVLAKYSRGEGLDLKNKNIKNKVIRHKFNKKEELFNTIEEQAARTELLLTEDHGFLEADTGESTYRYTQKDIVDNVDLLSATKSFELHLDFGPYSSRYTRNGRHLVIGGKKGHVAAFDWLTKTLACEINVMESVYDVCWLHIETMFAVAQKEWVYIYDNQGIELHCLKRMNQVTHLDFLPYHFLLASAASTGCLTWLDVSIGEIVSRIDSKLGRISTMAQNPSNAVLCVGDSKGVVSMWSPNSDQPLAKMLCHKQAISSCAIHPYGIYMATSSPDRSIKVWDIRHLAGPVHNLILPSASQHLSYSQRGLLAISRGNVIEIFRDSNNSLEKYIRHKITWNVSSMNFCPYEDVLGFGHMKGFSSILIPGSGEANFDALEANPFQTKKQRREAEIKALLDKIQPEFITLDTSAIGEIDVPTLKDRMEAKERILYIKPKNIDFKPRKTKAKGKGGTAKIVKSKKVLKELAKRKAIEAMRESKTLIDEIKAKPEKTISYGAALDRFLPKKK